MNELLNQLQPSIRALDVGVKFHSILLREALKGCTQVFKDSAILYKSDLELLILTLRNLELLLHILQFSGPETEEILEELGRFPTVFNALTGYSALTQAADTVQHKDE
jgi:hypothetical protein